MASSLVLSSCSLVKSKRKVGSLSRVGSSLLLRSASTPKRMIAKAAQSKQLAESDKLPLIEATNTFIFDCDGVIWKGDCLIEGIEETLDMLRSMGKRLIFVTNNSTKSRKSYAKKFESLGLKVTPVCTSYRLRRVCYEEQHNSENDL